MSFLEQSWRGSEVKQMLLVQHLELLSKLNWKSLCIVKQWAPTQGSGNINQDYLGNKQHFLLV